MVGGGVTAAFQLEDCLKDCCYQALVELRPNYLNVRRATSLLCFQLLLCFQGRFTETLRRVLRIGHTHHQGVPPHAAFLEAKKEEDVMPSCQPARRAGECGDGLDFVL